MPLIKYGLLIFFACLSCSISANTYLNQHVQAVGQTMSALYMQGLSEGNAKYERDLERYKQKASDSLNMYLRAEPEATAELERPWNTLKGEIKATFTEEFGWDVDSAVRRNFRTYLSKVYQLSVAKADGAKGLKERYEFTLVQLEAVIARFFDISSTYNGTVSLSNSDLEMLDPKVVSKEFKQSLDELASAGLGLKAKDIRSAKFKWEFIEESVVNYSDESAYFLVYATKNKISKVLSSGQVMLSHHN
mgnify:CR=1 FL=1